jgi:glutamate synthase domain-containing protein 2/glutamate synthase domain-containing protein 1/glutamate synthase domain-containing protein 3
VRDHDACGIGLVADRRRRRTRAWLDLALEALVRVTHRGASGDGCASVDGAGMLTAIPWTVLTRDLPRSYANSAVPRAAGQCFLPADGGDEARAAIGGALEREGWADVTWRIVPTDPDWLGRVERRSRPCVAQVFARSQAGSDRAPYQLDRALYRARLGARALLAKRGLAQASLVSLSTRTLVYKALVTPAHLARFYPDLADPAYETPFAVFHQRFSTNTFPEWALAQPFRVIAHNGEINTILGNRLQSRRRQASDATPGAATADAAPDITWTGSDSESLDDAVELHRQAGFSLAHTLARLLPRAWEHDPTLSSRERAFEAFQSTCCQPWEGPAAVVFGDGRQAGAVQDRNGFRPLRSVTTTDGVVCVGSEAGMFDVPQSAVTARGRLGPGEMLLVDLETGRIIENAGIRRALAAGQPYREWLSGAVCHVAANGPERDESLDLPRLQRVFGYTAEELAVIVRPMAADGKEAVGSMGDDTPLAVLSSRRRLLSDFFRQRFAQVTNPPLDPLREQSVMSTRTVFGRHGPLLNETRHAGDARLIACDSPILSAAAVDALNELPDRPMARLPMLFEASHGEDGFRDALNRLAADAGRHAREGAVTLLLTDCHTDDRWAPLPAPLAVSTVSNALAQSGLGARAGLVVQTGEVRDTHQAAVLLAFGAAAIHPWLALATASTMGGPAAAGRWRSALEHGLLKILSKMGVCTIRGYIGSQLFEILGLTSDLAAASFPDTPLVRGTLSLSQVAREAADWHQSSSREARPVLPHPGFHGFRNNGDYHAYNPALVRRFHKAVADGSADAYARFTELVYERPPTSVRDLLAFKPGTAVPLGEVESVDGICRRFFASAMSVGALGPEAHRTLAAAMNHLGGRSNSGEGGEEPERYARPLEGHWANSSTKQVASARFGVTPAYLASATELQIKMAQGSKPGEGGQLPAAKVVDLIARLRHAQPQTALISPPPHHDIYSIEDLAQLVYDLRTFSPTARINVKLVATTGVGVIAAGVVKAGADVIQISGHDGGTGASPRGSIKHAGLPWEFGLSEAHRVLTSRGMRERVVLQTDGGLKTGRDVALAAALGADEFGFGTAAVVALGCVMARQCHLNTCPVGIATQRPELRARFDGTVDQVITYLRLVAGEVREIMAALGVRSLSELVGRVDFLEPRQASGSKGVDAAPLLQQAGGGHRPALPGARESLAAPARTLNSRLAARASAALGREALTIRAPIRNVDRTVGAAIAGEIARRTGDAGVPGTPVRLELTGSAGQSFGAFTLPGMHLDLVGEANDGVGKSMRGGTIAIRPACRDRVDEVLVGNAALYGATGGRLYVAGLAGERFAVRNSGAWAVVEGVGHHGCEYMTGGGVVVLGHTGRNFAAGMTGGVAYAYDPAGTLPSRVNMELVTVEVLESGDEAVVRQLVIEHHGATDSLVAATLLAGWTDCRVAFWKISPRPLVVETAAHQTAGLKACTTGT